LYGRYKLFGETHNLHFQGTSALKNECISEFHERGDFLNSRPNVGFSRILLKGVKEIVI
jgi:hypothetical protein